MFKHSTFTVESLHRVVAMLVATAVVVWSVGVFNNAQAANLAVISNTLSDSDVSALSNHTIQFTIPTSSPGVIAGGTIVVTFPAGFNLATSGVAFGDVDFTINGAQQTLAAADAGATWGATVSGQNLTLESGTGVVTAGQVVRILVGTNATGGTNRVTNPSTVNSYEFIVTAGAADSGRTRVAILDNVDVTAVVNTSFTFTVAGLATSTAVNGTSTTGSTTATSIPFGVLTAGQIKTLAQRLNVTTNARNGFVVTVEQDGNLQSSTGADIDGFRDGAYTNSPEVWGAAPTNNIADENTWGHWGLTSSDDLNGDEFGVATPEFVAASTTPRQIFTHSGPSDGTTDNIGSSTVGYQIQISPLQEAGDDYTTVLTYIATPTF
ncbi:MAG: hypothetical protein V4606_00770 [Patescibacteria group bacterium]